MKAALHNDIADVQALADEEAVLRHLVERTPVPDEIARRVRERAAGITDEIRRTKGDVDVAQLLRDARDE